MPPYPVAALMLLAWPIITALIFARMERVNAVIWSLLLGYMFLPPNVVIDLPGIPGLSKYEIASLSTFLMVVLGMGKKADERDPMAGDTPPNLPGIIKMLIFGLFVSAVTTGITNTDPLIEGITYRPGHDSAMVAGLILLQWVDLIPFFLAFKMLSTPTQTKKLLVALMIASLIYSVPMLMEVRLSPQLNVWVYGYFQHDFVQTIRYNGFRPIVFMNHPIWVASFATTAFLATICLARAFSSGARMVMIVLYLAAVLALCKTASAVLVTLFAAPLIAMASPRRIMSVSALLAILVMAYPVLRLADIIPTADIVAFVNESQPERAASLRVRFENEYILLERAMQRPMFGWGLWGRQFPLNPETGRMMAISDGAWVIWYGTRGVFGYLMGFGLLCMPIIILWRRKYELMLRHDNSGALMVSALSLMLAVNLFELIPNATITPLTWLMNGAVLGHAARLRYTRDARSRWKKQMEELEKLKAAAPMPARL